MADEQRLPCRIPVAAPHVPAVESVLDDLAAILRSGRLTKGPYVERLEAAVAERLGVRHAVAVSSCTTGLMLVYRGLAGASRGRGRIRDEVVMPSFTFLAAPAAAVWSDLKPVFIDVDPTTMNVDPEGVARGITPRTAAICGCHTFGNPCDVAGLERVADAHGLPLLIDAAHAFGARLAGRQVGAGGTAQVFSLSPTKLLVAGEGGIVATDHDWLAAWVRAGREYGHDGSYDPLFAGLNGRMPELSAALAVASLALLDQVAAARTATAAAYRQRLEHLPGIGFMEPTATAEPSYKDFSITLDAARLGATRDAVRRALTDRGIETRCYFDPPCHRQTAFRQFHEPRQTLPITDRLASRSLTLPMGPHVDDDVVAEVCAVIAGVAQGCPA
jgi:dTDP-4-amino-4,6-dideoxygalactose transaminase